VNETILSEKDRALLTLCANTLGKVMQVNGMDIQDAANAIRAAVSSEQVKPPTTGGQSPCNVCIDRRGLPVKIFNNCPNCGRRL
jgi:predicted small secreted protein